MAANQFSLTGSGVNSTLGSSKSFGGNTSTPQTSGIMNPSFKPNSYYNQSIGNLTGILNQAQKTGAVTPVPSTPVKSVTTTPQVGTTKGILNQSTSSGFSPSPSSSGQPSNGIVSSPSSSGQPSNAFDYANQPPNGGSNLQGLTGQPPAPQYTQSPDLYGKLVTGLANTTANPDPLVQSYLDQLNQLTQRQAEQNKNIETGGVDLSLATGQEGVLNRLAAQKQGALETGLSRAVEQQKLRQAALGTAAGLAKPILGAIGEVPFSPTSGTQGNILGTQGGLSGVETPSNIKSIQDLTTQNNNMLATANGAEANMQLAINTAKQGGVVDTNVPFLNTMQQKLGVNFDSNPAVINFRTALNTVRSMYATILGNGESTDLTRNQAMSSVPDNISLGALQALANQLKAEVQNRVAGNIEQINKLKGTSQSSSVTTPQTGSTQFSGSAWK